MTLSAPASPKMLVGGWGRYPLIETVLLRPESVAGLVSAVAEPNFESKLGRGLGRAYGDAAVNGRGATILTEKLNRMLAFDQKTGVLRCEAGVTIEDLIETFMPRGWFPLVVPGTKYVTVGGAIASDIHGKNHHRDGSFVNAVRSFTLLTAKGDTLTCSRTLEPDLFWATLGGMGLTGIIVDVELKLQPIATSYINCRSIRTRNLAETLDCFSELEPEFQYSVAWIDCLASKSQLGRGIVMFGNHAQLQDLNPALRSQPLAITTKQAVNVPFDLPGFLLNRYSIAAFNQCFYSAHVGKDRERLLAYEPYFFPLDRIRSWNRLYGANGFVQYQCVVPTGREEAIAKMLELSAQYGMSSFLAVLKRFGPERGLLSFPQAGLTLTLDMPVRGRLFELIDRLNDLVLKNDGRVYLAKDSSLTAEHFRIMYPNYKRWLAIKSRFDPGYVFRSALAERLALFPSEVISNRAKASTRVR
jgi:decaprenylphospho-beta-D-ribofuranose 2-oxidase